jgi:SAM-dependent methyltransferase
MNPRRKKRTLYGAVVENLSPFPRGKLLDAGAGSGLLSKELAEIGFEVTAADIDRSFLRVEHPGIRFVEANFNGVTPFADGAFDYIVCLEMIEHVENPFALLREFQRILRPGGTIILSTPNILNIGSRLRFLLEGNYEYFKYPLPEWERDGTGSNLHVNPIRLHEMEYYFLKAGLAIDDVFTSRRKYGLRLLFPLELAIRIQSAIKVVRSRRPKEIDLTRLYRHILSDDLLYGEHLLIRARKDNDRRT